MFKCGKCDNIMTPIDTSSIPKWYYCNKCNSKLMIDAKNIMHWTDADGNPFTPLPIENGEEVIEEIEKELDIIFKRGV